MNGVICDDCLKIIMYNLTKDDITILNFLSKNKCINVHLSMDKTKIMPSIQGMTDFKFNSSISRLEVCNLIGRIATARPNKYYLKQDGINLLKLYVEDTQRSIKGK